MPGTPCPDTPGSDRWITIRPPEELNVAQVCGSRDTSWTDVKRALNSAFSSWIITHAVLLPGQYFYFNKNAISVSSRYTFHFQYLFIINDGSFAVKWLHESGIADYLSLHSKHHWLCVWWPAAETAGFSIDFENCHVAL